MAAVAVSISTGLAVPLRTGDQRVFARVQQQTPQQTGVVAAAAVGLIIRTTAAMAVQA